MTRPSPSGGTRHTATLLHARQAPRRLRGGRGAVNSAMEPEPEDEEQAAAAAATEAPDESTVAAARVSIAGHEIAAKSTTSHRPRMPPDTGFKISVEDGAHRSEQGSARFGHANAATLDLDHAVGSHR